MYHLIFDTETTGLPKRWGVPMSETDNFPRLVQLSWVLTNGEDREEFDYIIKPDGFEIPESVAKIHGITQERALAEGKSLKMVMDIFRVFINLADKVVAHNIEFDQSIVGAEYYRLGIGESFEKRWAEKTKFCTMKSSTDILKIKGTHAGGNKYPKLIELYKHFFNENFDGAHNSLMDTRACERCYFELLATEQANNNWKPND